MKSLFLVGLFAVVSFNSFAQTELATAMSDSRPRKEIPCCAKCAGPNAVVNPAVLQNGQCNGDFTLIWVKADKCVHQTIQNHPKCAGK